ncbi:unnamed protein product [Polarella glacialis]|uniref:Uncharacterized protein n=1 Tax=Polarella glacialis TaxID=89957 RepID=A0A813G311_POLGL|nr:unnamed protein product [Polarella glacialis]
MDNPFARVAPRFRIDHKRRRLARDDISPVLDVVISLSKGSECEVSKVHASILHRVPYFEAYLARWSPDQQLSYKLPPGLDFADWETLVKLYNGKVLDGCCNMRSAIAIYSLVDSLSFVVDDQLSEKLLEDICNAARTAEDIDILRTSPSSASRAKLSLLVEEFELESRLVVQRLAERLVKDPGVPADDFAVDLAGDFMNSVGLKIEILRQVLGRRAQLGLRRCDVHTILEVLGEHALTFIDNHYVGLSPHVTRVWELIEGCIDTHKAWTKARSLVHNLCTQFHRVTQWDYRPDPEIELTVNPGRLPELCKRFVLLSVELAAKNIIPCTADVLGAVEEIDPQDFAQEQPSYWLFRHAVTPALATITSRLDLVELLLPHLCRLRCHTECLVPHLQVAPLAVAKKVALHMITSKQIAPCRDLYQLFHDRGLV